MSIASTRWSADGLASRSATRDTPWVPNTVSPSPPGAFIAAFWAAFIGGLLLTLGIFVALPDALMLVAAILFVSSVIAVFALSVAGARRTHEGLLRSLARGAGNSVRWLFEFLPP